MRKNNNKYRAFLGCSVGNFTYFNVNSSNSISESQQQIAHRAVCIMILCMRSKSLGIVWANKCWLCLFLFSSNSCSLAYVCLLDYLPNQSTIRYDKDTNFKHEFDIFFFNFWFALKQFSISFYYYSIFSLLTSNFISILLSTYLFY